MHKILGEKCIV